MFFKKKSERVEETPPQREVAPSPLDVLRTRATEAHLPHHVMEVVSSELKKLEKTDAAIAEYSVGINYIELLLSLPWNISSQCKLDLAKAQSVLDTRHYGLSQVKQRILEFLAAKTLCSKAQQTILIVDDEEIARTNMMHVLAPWQL